MPSFEFTSPEGKKYRVGAPEGATQAQAFAMLQKQLGQPAQPIQQPSTQPIQRTAQQPEQQGFLSRVGTSLKSRVDKAEKIKAAHRAGTRTLPESILQGVGKVGAGIMWDVTGEAITSAGKTLQLEETYRELPEGVRKTIESNPVLKFGISMAQRGSEVYDKWAKQNPRFAENLEAAVNIASFFPIPTGKLLGKAGKVGKEVSKGVGEVTAVRPIAKGLMSPSTGKMRKVMDNLKETANSTIKDIKGSGVVFGNKTGNALIKSLDDAMGSIKGGALLDRVEDVAKKIAGFKNQILAGDTSMSNIYFQRKTLSELESLGGDKGALARKALDGFDEVLNSPTQHLDIIGGNPKMAGAIKKYNKQYSQYKGYEQVAAATELASESAAKSRKAFQKIVKSRYFSGLSPEVQRLSKIATKGKIAGKFMDNIGVLSRIFSLGAVGKKGAVVGGLTTGIVPAINPTVGLGVAGSMAAAKSGKLIQRGTAADVLKAIRDAK